MNEYISQQSCPDQACGNYGKQDNSTVAVHDKRRNRLRCRNCGKTWSAHAKEFHYGLRVDQIKIRRAVDMLQARLPIRTIARLVKISPSTVQRWKKKLVNYQ